jgi:hypothetical protein
MAEFKLGRLKFWWKGEWQTGQAYVKDDVVRFGGKSYVCTGAHTSGSNDESFYTALETAPFKWELMTDGISWQGLWTTGTYYKVGDVVKFGSDSYICINGNTAGADFLADQDVGNWDNFVNGVELEGDWSSSAAYQVGDIVRYGGYTYLAKQDNTNASPETDTTSWGIFVYGLRQRGAWSSSTTYHPGDVVKKASSSYSAKQTHTNHDPSNDISETYWQNLVQGSDSSVITTKGDLPTYGTSGAVRLPVGGSDAVLQVDSTTGIPAWKTSVNIPGDLTVSGNAHIVQGEVYQGNNAQSLEVDVGIYDISTQITSASKTPGVLKFNYSAGSQLASAAIGWSVTISGLPDPNTVANSTFTIASINTTSRFITMNVAGLTGTSAVWLGNAGDLNVQLRTPTAYKGITNASGVFVKNADDFVQFALKNTNNGSAASTDLIVYADNGDNESGWMDMGITSSGYGSPDWTVTKNNDGYLFCNAPVGTTGNGDLVIGTGGNGAHNDITFFTGGFDASQIKMKLIGTARPEIQASTGIPTGKTIEPGVEIYLDSVAEAYDQGALRITGGLGVQGNIITKGDLRAEMGMITQGSNAKRLTEDNYSYTGYTGITNASAIMTGNANDFVQMALKNFNTGASASTDLILYSSKGDNTSGWIDMGICSENYNDPSYGVTSKGDGYIFMSAKAGSTDEKGNLYLSTSGYGTMNDIVFSTGGFANSSFERMRIIGTSRSGHQPGVEIYSTSQSTSTTTGALRVQGGIGLQGNLNVGGSVNIVGDTTIQGTIVIAGGSTTVTSQNLAVSDPLIFSGDGNSSDLVDLGAVGSYRAAADSYTSAALSGATITTSGATVNIYKVGHGAQSKDTITISGVTNQTSYNGTYTTITIVDANNITVTKVGGTFTGGLIGGTATLNTFVNGLRYAGLARDHIDGRYKLFTAYQVYNKPSTTITFANTTKAVFDCGAIYAGGSVTSTGAAVFSGTGASSFGGAGSFAGDVSLGSGTATSSYTTGALKVSGGVGITGGLYVQNASFFGNDITAWYSSDRDLKTNITPIAGALDKIAQIGGYTFNWKPEADKGEAHDVGVIAQEIQAVQPEVVVKRDNGYLAVNYEKLVPLLIQGIKELQEEVKALRAKVGA